MLKKIILTLLVFCSINTSLTFADDGKKANWVLFYEQCNILLDKTDTKNIAELWENLCIFIKNNNSETYTILAKKKNNFSLELINKEILDYLKKNYYRWERINIILEWNKKEIAQKLNFDKKYFSKYDTLDSDYKIEFLEDNLLNTQEFWKILTKNCKFNSYFPTCSDNYKQNIIKKIEKILLQNLFNRDKLLSSSLKTLEIEKEKINIIKNKIKYLDKYYSEKQKNSDKIIYSENIKFTINFLIYKLEIYSKILENRIWDLEFKDFLVKNKIYFIDKKLIWNLYISQNDQFTFFYYWNKRINTLKNSISHFDDDELELDKNLVEENIEYLKEKIREKYSAKYVKNTDKKLILITKKYLSKEKYLLFDTTNNKIFQFYWDIEKIEIWKKWYYILSKNYAWDIALSLYNWKTLQEIIEPSKNYKIYDFELLVWKKIKLFYSNKDNAKNESIVDISEY